MLSIREEFQPTSRPARRCSTPASATSASRKPASACARAGGRRAACRSSSTPGTRSSARCGSGMSPPRRAARRCCSGRIAVDPRLPGPRPGREADAHGARAGEIARPRRPCCSSAMRPTTLASASRRRTPARSGCPVRWSATASSASSSRPARSPGRGGLSPRPARSSRTPAFAAASPRERCAPRAAGRLSGCPNRACASIDFTVRVSVGHGDQPHADRITRASPPVRSMPCQAGPSTAASAVRS